MTSEGRVVRGSSEGSNYFVPNSFHSPRGQLGGALNVRNSFRYKKRVLEYALVRGEVRRASFVRRKYRLDTVLHLN